MLPSKVLCSLSSTSTGLDYFRGCNIDDFFVLCLLVVVGSVFLYILLSNEIMFACFAVSRSKCGLSALSKELLADNE